MDITATEAKNRFGQRLDHAQREPVFIGKSGRRHGVLLSVAHYDLLMAAQTVKPLGKRSDAAREFYQKYKGWVDMQNELVEKFGIPGEEFRAW